jgi:uncharacterized protein YjbI with pentapeptide repeats
MTDFICEVDERYRSACKDLPKYPGSRYCVLHEPDEEKTKEDFLRVKKSKLDRKDYDFGGTIFPDGTSDFQGFEFDANPNFAGATFVGDASFQGAKFSGNWTNFREAKFSAERTDFSGAQFTSARTYFSRAQFSSVRTYFQGAQFSGARIHFSGVRFESERTDFSQGQFSGDTYFQRAEFRDWTDFREVQFSGEQTDFSQAEFVGEMTSFERAEFSGERTDFSRAKFNAERTDFLGAKFSAEQASLSEAYFSGEWASFSEAYFSGEWADFSGTEFGNAETYFRETTLATEVYFNEAAFRDKVLFRGSSENTVFRSQAWARFAYSRIDKPELLTFNGVLLHPGWFVNADVRKVDFTDVKWYGMPGGPEGSLHDELQALQQHGFEDDSRYALLSQACRRLSASAEENREYPLANEFHYWSMDALRKRGWRSLGVIGTLYWALSGYGVRAGRALGVLATMVVVFSVLYMMVGHHSLRVLPIAGIWQVLTDAGRAVMYSVGVMARLRPEPIPEHMGMFQILVTIEGILGPLQIALLALAIRRKVMR